MVWKHSFVNNNKKVPKMCKFVFCTCILKSCFVFVFSRKFHDRRGFEVKNIIFSPGRMNLRFMIQYTDSVMIWELQPEGSKLSVS